MSALVKESVRHLVYFIYRVIPKRNLAVVYGWPDFEDNTLALQAGLEQTIVSKVVLLVTGVPEHAGFELGKKTIVVRKNSLRGAWYFLQARYVFFTHRSFMFRFPPNVVSVNVWHGMPIKKIGWMLEGNRGYESKYALATSDFWAGIVNASLRPFENTLVTGLPRNDRLLAAGNGFWERLGLTAAVAGKKIIGWLPTYRKSVTGEIRSDGVDSGNVFGMEGISPEELNEFLRQRQGFAIVKPHPMAGRAANRQLSNLLIIDDAWLRSHVTSLYALLGQCDLLVTDMSSVVVDYLVLDRPVIHLIADLSEYRASRGFSIEPVEDYFAGPLATSAGELFAQLAAALRGEDSHREQRRRIRHLFHAQPDANATQRLMAALNLSPRKKTSEAASMETGLPELLSEGERQKILVAWNQTRRPYPRDKCIHQLFAEQAAQTPDATAVVFEKSRLTYQELNRRADQVAGHLQQLGVRPGIILGLFVERSLEMAVALLGILKAGGAYCSLEESLPEERLRWLLADARVEIMVARKDSVQRLANLIGKTPSNRAVVVAIEDLLAVTPESKAPEEFSHRAEMPAYVSYTSGSTGQPKGVLVPHRGVVRLVKGADYASLTADETLLHMAPLSFDASTFEIWGALLNGGRLVIMPPRPCSLAEIGEAIRQNGVTTLWLTTGLFHLMVEERLDDLKPLRQLLTGGDVMLPKHFIRARQALKGCRINNMYGPTENTTFTSGYTATDEAGLAAGVPIGRPVANTRVYVLDSRLKPVPVGAEGELYVGGDGLALGYLNRPELTAEKFISSPFEADARLYRTGDMARWRSDGNLEFLGRRDSQVKIRGFRIELGEVESALGTHPQVAACAVTTQHLDDGNKLLAAFVVARESADITAEMLRSWLKNKLPDYMVPGRFLQLPALPLNANGKVDRKSLDELPAREMTGDGGFEPPRNELERKLADLWKTLLRREQISIRENFFHLGGDSLLAVQLACAVEKMTGVDLPMATLFQSPTIESLARRLSEKDWSPAWSSLVPLKTEGSRPPLFFVHGVRGEVYRYLELVRRLPADQPCYGIQAVGLDGRKARHVTVEEMAAHYVEELLAFQPAGAFYLAGYSMGGWIAYEMAQQLRRRGRRVMLLALFDSGPAGKVALSHYASQMAVFIPRRCVHHLRRWLKLPRREQFAYLRRRWISFRQLFIQNRDQMPAVTAPPEKSSQPPKVAGDYIDYYHAVAASYQIREYPGPVEVFVSDQHHPGWKSYWKHQTLGGASIHRIPGEHFEIFSEPNVPVFAEIFGNVLRRAQQQEHAQDQQQPQHSSVSSERPLVRG